MLDKNICEIKNPKHMKMMSKIQSFRFESMKHIPGKSNRLADALSRLTKLVSRTNFVPEISSKPKILNFSKNASSKTGHLMREDPLVPALAEAGSLDPDYLMMCNLVEDRCKSS